MSQERFKVLDQPCVAPAKCATCGVGHNDNGRRKFIDTGLDLDFYGTVYMCTSCLTEIAESLGYIPSSTWGGIREFNSDLLKKIGELGKENEQLRNSVSSLSSHHCASSGGVVAPDEPQGGAKLPKEPVKVGEGAKPDAVKHDGVKGLPSVRGDAKPNGDAISKLGI